MDIQQIKDQIGLKNLVMVRQFEQDTNTPTPWLSHWENDSRIRVTMHEEVFNQIKADPEKSGLAVKKELIHANGERAEYIRFVVITPRNIEGTF